MGIRYSKKIKIGDLLSINISKTGVSATIGPKGASINLGKNGTYLNLSPSAVGLKGTGVSYRKKLTGGYSGLVHKLLNRKSKDEFLIDNDEINEYSEQLENTLCIHKSADKVLNEDEFNEKIESLDSDATKQIYELSKKGDEDTIEALVGSFLANFNFKYEVKCNFELEEHVLYVDLDLPEIETLSKEYPSIKNDKTVNIKKTNEMLKEEYANTVLSLSVYLSANFFNLSSYIDQIVISGFTSKRNNDGDLVDEYLYSIKFTRDIFMNTNLSEIDDIYEFILKFENRINYNPTNYTFKSIKPFEMESVTKMNSLIEDAVNGLKELGYKNDVINNILPKLNELKLESSSEYLKEALKLISNS